LFGGLGGINAPTAVNTLIQVSGNGSCILLSESIAKKVSDKCANAFVVKARDVCRDNPAWQGWVHEIDFIARMKQCHKGKKPFILQRTGWTHSVPYVSGSKTNNINVVDNCRVGTLEDQASGTFYILQK
jgi:hypothetical protein